MSWGADHMLRTGRSAPLRDTTNLQQDEDDTDLQENEDTANSIQQDEEEDDSNSIQEGSDMEDKSRQYIAR